MYRINQKNWKSTFIPFAKARKRTKTSFSQLAAQFGHQKLCEDNKRFVCQNNRQKLCTYRSAIGEFYQ